MSLSVRVGLTIRAVCIFSANSLLISLFSVPNMSWQLVTITHRMGCWSNNSANCHPSPGAFNRRVLRACLVPQCSYPPHRPCHQRRLSNCGWMPASPADNLPILAGIQPAELRRNGATLPLARRAKEPGHLLQSALSRPSSANARRLKSRHPFVPAAQHLNKIRVAQWAADHQWNAEWTDNLTRLRIFIPDTGSQPLEIEFSR